MAHPWLLHFCCPAVILFTVTISVSRVQSRIPVFLSQSCLCPHHLILVDPEPYPPQRHFLCLSILSAHLSNISVLLDLSAFVLHADIFFIFSIISALFIFDEGSLVLHLIFFLKPHSVLFILQRYMSTSVSMFYPFRI